MDDPQYVAPTSRSAAVRRSPSGAAFMGSDRAERVLAVRIAAQGDRRPTAGVGDIAFYGTSRSASTT
jgi:hypothetical protein